jgi:MOSC domain-containing protein YiiM
VANALVISVNTGRAQAVGWAGRTQRSAIDKRPAAGPLAIGPLGVQGDEQADSTYHGGVEQAVYAYAREDLDWWAGQLGLKLRDGVFGENITSAGLDISGAVIGETWRLGSAVVQITSVRVPCGTFAGWMGQRGWVKRFALAGRPGAYLRVLEEGVTAAGDPIEVLSRPPDSVTVAGAMRAFYGDAELMRRLLDAPGLDPEWHEMIASALERESAGSAQPSVPPAEPQPHEAQPHEAQPHEAQPHEALG